MKTSNEHIDGGVVCKGHCVNTQSKTEPTELIKFHCVFSLLALTEPSFLGSRVYSLDAVVEDGIVKGCLDWYCEGEGEKTTFESNLSFMTKLQKIISKYNLSQHNGCVNIISGLPDMYGFKLDIVYKNGEYIYAHNNEDCFLPIEMMEESVKLFKSAC